MKIGYRLPAVFSLILVVSCGVQGLDYPETPTVELVETIHGVEVRDPYRWLEDLDSDDTRKWIESQNQLSFAYLEKLPGRNEIIKRLTQVWDYEKYDVPQKKAGTYFLSRNDGLQNQSVVYVMDQLDGEPTVLLDPNRLSEDGTVALADYEISPDGKLMAYGLSSGGSDWREWRVREISSRDDLPDHLRWVKFSGVSWTPDSKGFYYSRYDEPESGKELQGTVHYQKVYYHRIGDTQDRDQLIYERPDQKEWGFGAEVTEDGRYLILSVWTGSASSNGIFVRNLSRKDSETVELLSQFDARYEFLGSRDSVLWFHTDFEAPRGRVIGIDLDRPARDYWETLIPESESTIDKVAVVNHQFVVHYLKDAQSQVRVLDEKGELVRELELPGIGTADGWTGEPDDTETFYSFTSFGYPETIYHLDLETGESTIFRKPRVDFDTGDYETRQVFYESKDGTRIPMFVTSKKGLSLNGSNPTLLYGYGGFNISMTPSFSVTNLVWMERGGVYALANIRGGGEYGEQWHEAGTKLNKQNVFDDFVSAAEWLIENGYTSSSYLAIDGASNGGLLVGAVLNQRPNLFGAATPRVGVMDMLRFHKFTIGWAWVPEFGSPENEEDFKAIYAYSPYHNIKVGAEYPPTLIMTADHDDRVVPSHSFKYAAALQKAQSAPAPILIRIETRAGHGAGKPTTKRIEEAADKLAFLLDALGSG
jgi:prolyl oligopeptidase